MEKIVADALNEAGVAWVPERGTDTELDFYLPDLDLYIEVKRFHSARIAEQMSRAPNVIALQGEQAVRWFAALLAGGVSRTP